MNPASDDNIKMGPLPFGTDEKKSDDVMPPLDKPLADTPPSTTDSLPIVDENLNLGKPQDISPPPSGEIKPARKMNPKLIIGALAIVGFLVAGGIVAFQSSGTFLSESRDDRSKADCNCDGHTTCGSQADNHQNCRKYVCDNGSWRDIGAANSGPCTGGGGGSNPPPPPPPPPTNPPSSGGGGGCQSGWSCNGHCASAGDVSSFNSVWCDGRSRWMQEAGCGGGGSAPRSSGCGAATPRPTTAPTSSGGGGTTSGSTCGAEGAVRCRPNAQGVNEFNDVCRNGSWTAGGNACTPTSGGGTPAAGCVGGVSCTISYCNDNHAVPPDPCYRGGSCISRTTSQCAGHNGVQPGVGGVTPAPSGTTTTTSGNVAVGGEGATCTVGQRGQCGTGGCAAGQQRICMSGGRLGGCVRSDACASQVQAVTTGQSCAGLVRLSNGEPSNGGFVGCQGALNCFCTVSCPPNEPNNCGIAGTGTVRCIADNGNDSCGAPGMGTVVVNNVTQTPAATATQAPNAGGGGGGGTTTTTTTPTGTTTVTTTVVPGQCIAVKLYVKDTAGEWIATPFTQAASKVKVGDTVRLSTNGTGRVFTQGRFRIKVGTAEYGNWQTTTTKDKGEFYINYVIPSAGTFAVQSQVF